MNDVPYRPKAKKVSKVIDREKRRRELQQAVTDALVELDEAQTELREAERELDEFLSEEPDDAT